MGSLSFRPATSSDVPAVVGLIYDDEIAAGREAAPGSDVDAAYYQAFALIDANPHDGLVVGELEGQLVACAQLTLLHHLSRRGGTRAQVESVRVSPAHRGLGIGAALMRHLEQVAYDRGARLIQLTSDKRRTAAHRFYERLGYVGTHEGMKRALGCPLPRAGAGITG